MATRVLRRGLPRVPGGEPWPPADTVAAELAAAGGTDAGPAAEATPIHEAPVDAVAAAAVTAAPSASAPSASAPSAGAAPAGTAGRSGLRRGLPRVPGGEPWPPADAASSVTADVASVPGTSEGAKLSAPAAAPAAAATAPAVATETAAASTVSPAAVAQTAAVPGSESGANVRRGLPRVAGGEPWPPAGTVPALQGVSSRSASPSSLDDRGSASAAPSSLDHRTVEADLVPVPASAVAVPAVADLDAPLRWTRTVWNGRAPRHITAAPDSGRRRPTWTQAIAVLLGAAALGLIAGAAVAFVRTLLSFPFMQDFLAAFPGHYEPAIAVEPGFSPWIGWQHFFNMFLMVLIIRSGLQVRTEKRPTVFWTPRGNAKGKISLNLWFHQSLDILWLVNGVIFVVLLFVTGHWVRIVPTSWEVFPNALSAALQYVSFDWPHENGWNNYNSLQQLAYFATVFLAAPLAAITGFRMSGLWPKSAEKLSKAYPVEWARALHFPIMLYFVAFIIAHVALVMLTGFLANLNHMFAAQDAVTWTGFWVFIGALVVIAIGWVAARPLVLAPIAKAFGKVSGR